MRLSVQDISIERGGRQIVEGLSFSLSGGQAMAVTGPNGAGKTSLLRAIAGLLPVSSGTIVWSETNPALNDTALATHFVGHADGLKNALTAHENLAFWQDMLRTGAVGITPKAALDQLDLGHALAFPVGNLSAGQRRRVALARLLVAPRPLWLLDEPANALDTKAQGMLVGLMQSHLAIGGMVLAATHVPLGLDGMLSLNLGAGQ